MVRVAELEYGFTGVAGVELDGARVGKRVIRAAREREINAVVNDDVTEEIGLYINDIHLAHIIPTINLNLRAAAVVDKR